MSAAITNKNLKLALSFAEELQQAAQEGDLEGETVTCPWHGWEYNVKTGHCANNPSSNIKSYESMVEDGDVKVEL